MGANETLQKLNQAELPDFPGRKVTIVRSELNNKLFIGNIPREVRRWHHHALLLEKMSPHRLLSLALSTTDD